MVNENVRNAFHVTGEGVDVDILMVWGEIWTSIKEI